MNITFVHILLILLRKSRGCEVTAYKSIYFIEINIISYDRQLDRAISMEVKNDLF